MKEQGPGKDRRALVFLFLGAAVVKAGDGDWDRVQNYARLAARQAGVLARAAARRKRTA
jgi:hypothetical protein